MVAFFFVRCFPPFVIANISVISTWNTKTDGKWDFFNTRWMKIKAGRLCSYPQYEQSLKKDRADAVFQRNEGVKNCHRVIVTQPHNTGFNPFWLNAFVSSSERIISFYRSRLST